MSARRADGEPMLSAGREGSPVCCQVLLLLHKHGTGGLSYAELQEFLGVPRSDLQPALLGLAQRARIVHNGGHGRAGRWLLMRHAAQLQKVST